MIITILASANNKREQEWLNHWTYEFERIGCEVLINPELTELTKTDAVVFLSDGRLLEEIVYLKLGYFFHQKTNEKRKAERLMVAFDEAGNLAKNLSSYFDHITKTEKGLINTIKDYLYFTNKNVRAK